MSERLTDEQIWEAWRAYHAAGEFPLMMAFARRIEALMIQRLYTVTNPAAPHFLRWVSDRFVHALRRLADALDNEPSKEVIASDHDNRPVAAATAASGVSRGREDIERLLQEAYRLRATLILKHIDPPEEAHALNVALYEATAALGSLARRLLRERDVYIDPAHSSDELTRTLRVNLDRTALALVEAIKERDEAIAKLKGKASDFCGKEVQCK